MLPVDDVASIISLALVGGADFGGGSAGAGAYTHPLLSSTEPFLFTEATPSVHLSAQPESFLCLKPPNIASKSTHVKSENGHM
jgi:hypothetical protein